MINKSFQDYKQLKIYCLKLFNKYVQVEDNEFKKFEVHDA